MGCRHGPRTAVQKHFRGVNHERQIRPSLLTPLGRLRRFATHVVGPVGLKDPRSRAPPVPERQLGSVRRSDVSPLYRVSTGSTIGGRPPEVAEYLEAICVAFRSFSILG